MFPNYRCNYLFIKFQISNTKLQISSKFQTPNIKQIPMTKIQNFQALSRSYAPA